MEQRTSDITHIVVTRDKERLIFIFFSTTKEATII